MMGWITMGWLEKIAVNKPIKCCVVVVAWINFYRHHSVSAKIRVAPDFGSGKSGIRPFFGSLGKSVSGQISSRLLVPVCLVN